MATDLPDYYAVLQVHPDAESEVIDAAYRRLARKYHPDVNASPKATRRMAELNEAYAVLSDVERRASYDAQRLEEPARQREETRPLWESAEAYPSEPVPSEAKGKQAWWRWLLVPLAFAFGFFVPGFILRIGWELGYEAITFIDWPWKKWLFDNVARLMQSAAGGFCAVYFPAWIAPKAKRGTSMVAFSLLLLVYLVSALLFLYVRHSSPDFPFSDSPAWVFIDWVTTLAAGGYAVWYVSKELR